MKKKLRFGIIGTGHMGQYHVNVVSGLSTHELIGVFDKDHDLAEQIASKYNTKAFSDIYSLFQEVEAVTIATPTFLHYEIARMALENNCHVLIEKPITTTIEEASDLIEFAKVKKKIIQVGHVERFNGAVLELSKIVTNPYLIESRRISPFMDRIKDSGVVLDILIHDLDIVLSLVNSSVESFSAMGQCIKGLHEDIALINIRFENGCVASLTGSRLSQNKERSLSITQDKSFIFLNYAKQDIKIFRQASSASLLTSEEIKYSQESFVERLFIHKENPLKGEHTHFYDCIFKNQQPLRSNQKDLETLKIALESLKQIHGEN